MAAKFMFTTALYAFITVSSFAQNNSTMKPVNILAPVLKTKTILIHARPEKVWAVLTNIDQWNTWLTSVRRSRLNGALQANTTFDWKTGGTKIHSTLHTVEAYSNFGWTGKVYGIYGIHNWTFREVNGSTEITVSESMEGFLAHIFKKALNKTLEKDMMQSLELLKQTCEK